MAVVNSATVIFGAKLTVIFQILNSKLQVVCSNTLPTYPQSHLQQLSSLTQRQERPEASFCITHLKYHIYEASAKYGAEEASTDEKTVKNSEKQVLAPKLAVTCSKFKCLNSKFESQRWQERVELEDNTPHTTYIEFQSFFLLHDTPNEVYKPAKFE